MLIIQLFYERYVSYGFLVNNLMHVFGKDYDELHIECHNRYNKRNFLITNFLLLWALVSCVVEHVGLVMSK